MNILGFYIPERNILLDPWLTGGSINLLYAWRGIGKTQMALGISYAIGTKTSFLGWKAPDAQKVLYVDGEMPVRELKNRINSIGYISDNVTIFSSGIQDCSMPDLRTTEGQEMLDRLITKDTKLIIIDNLSCLVGGNENDAENWHSIGIVLVSGQFPKDLKVKVYCLFTTQEKRVSNEVRQKKKILWIA